MSPLPPPLSSRPILQTPYLRKSMWDSLPGWLAPWLHVHHIAMSDIHLSSLHRRFAVRSHVELSGWPSGGLAVLGKRTSCYSRYSVLWTPRLLETRQLICKEPIILQPRFCSSSVSAGVRLPPIASDGGG